MKLISRRELIPNTYYLGYFNGRRTRTIDFGKLNPSGGRLVYSAGFVQATGFRVSLASEYFADDHHLSYNVAGYDAFYELTEEEILNHIVLEAL